MARKCLFDIAVIYRRYVGKGRFVS